jgi:hypothetical protein
MSLRNRGVRGRGTRGPVATPASSPRRGLDAPGIGSVGSGGWSSLVLLGAAGSCLDPERRLLRRYPGAMTTYQAPLRDIRFVLEHVTPLSELTALDDLAHADPDLVAGLLEEAGRFAAEAIAPHQPRRRRARRQARRRWCRHPRQLQACLPAVRRSGLGHDPAPGRVRRRCLPPDRRQRGQGTDHEREHGVLARPVADHRCGLPADPPRLGATAADLPAQDGVGRVGRNHEPHRAAGRLRRRRGDDQGDPAGRRHLPHHRAEDLHHLR